MVDVAIAYRIYPRVSKVPIIFPDDKYKLSECCIRSLKESLKGVKYKIWVLLDGCPKEYEELFCKYFDSEDLHLINVDSIGNFATFDMQLDLLLKQNEAEYVYFAEDDYYYLPNTFKEMIDFMSANSDINFISPYDHLDYYTLHLHDYTNHIKANGKRHWRTVGSTCLTFLTSKKILQETEQIFRTYANNNFDASIWLSLTKNKIRNPLTVIKYAFRDILFFKIVVKAWIHSFGQIIFGRRYRLWVPLPTIATHMEKKYLSPVIDWNQVFSNEMKS